jgi:hypothetical protein
VAFDEADDVDLAGGDAREAVVDVDDEEEPVVLEHGAQVADAGRTVRLDAAHGVQGDERVLAVTRVRPCEGATDADDAVGEDYGGAGEVEDLELGLDDEEDVLDEDAVLGRELRTSLRT